MKKNSVLIVEDEESMLKILNEEFKDAGFETHSARDGQEGLEMALEKHPDAILLDILMPRMDGLAMLKKLRENDWGKNAMVFLLTNLSDIEKISEGVKAGVSGFLIKSEWQIGQIIEKVKAEIEKKDVSRPQNDILS